MTLGRYRTVLRYQLRLKYFFRKTDAQTQAPKQPKSTEVKVGK